MVGCFQLWHLAMPGFWALTWLSSCAQSYWLQFSEIQYRKSKCSHTKTICRSCYWTLNLDLGSVPRWSVKWVFLVLNWQSFTLNSPSSLYWTYFGPCFVENTLHLNSVILKRAEMNVRRRWCSFLYAVCGCISLCTELLFVGEQGGNSLFLIHLSGLGGCLRKNYLPDYLRSKWCTPFKICLNSNAVSDRFHLGVQTLTTQTRNFWWHSLCLPWLAFTWTPLDLSARDGMCTH